MSHDEADPEPPSGADPLDASGPYTRPTTLRDRTPFVRGEKIAYTVAAALWLLIPIVLLSGDYSWKSCVADATGDSDLCGTAMVMAVLVAIVLGVVGLTVAGVTAWQRARRLRRSVKSLNTNDA